MTRTTPLILLLIFAASIGVLAVIDAKYPSVALAQEIAKAVLQLGVVAIVGATVSLLVFEYQREKSLSDKARETTHQNAEKLRDIERVADEKKRDLYARRIEYRESLLLSVLSRAMGAYRQSKKARRLLRARSISQSNDGAMLLAETYDQYMDLINEAQLDLDNLARDVSTSSIAFTEHVLIVTSLQKMEAYLNLIIDEYESKRPLFPDTKSTRPLRDHPVLDDFLRSAKVSKFSPEVIRPYHEVQRAIRKDLLHPNFLKQEADA